MPFHVKHLVGSAWVVVYVFLFLLAVGAFITDCGGDSCIYIYVAQGILEGEIPYLDRWDNKGPLLYLLNLVGLLMHDLWGLWIVQGFFLLGASLFAFLTLRRGFGTTPALFSLAIFLIFFSKFARPGDFTEQYGLLFQFLTLYLFLRSREQPCLAPFQARFASLHLAIGFLGAASFLLRPDLVALWIVIGFYWLLLRDASLQKVAWAVVGGAGILALVAVFFMIVGAWGALWDAVFLFNLVQSDASFQDRLDVVRLLTTRMFPFSLLIAAAWCIGLYLLVWKKVQRGSVQALLAIAVILLPLEVIGISMSGFTYRHYYLTALPAAMLLLAFLVYLVAGRHLIAPSLLGFILLFSVSFYASPLSNYTPLVEQFERAGGYVRGGESPLVVRLRNLIQRSTEPHDPILVWGKGAWIYLFTDRDAPTRFFYSVPLTKPHYTDKAILDEFSTDVIEAKPKLIVDMRPSRLPPLARGERTGWRPTERYESDPADFKTFFDFVEANYLAVDTHSSFTIYAIRTDAGGGDAAIQGNVIIRSAYDVYLHDRTLTFVKSLCMHDDAAKRFILHVFPVDRSVINNREHANLDFSFIEGNTWRVGEMCVVTLELPDYPIAAIRTGQYNSARTGHDWLEEFHFTKPN